MIVNESQRDKTSQNRSQNTLKPSEQANQSQKTSERMQQSELSEQPDIFKFDNPFRNWQIILSIFITVLATLWVQITMQYHAPFIRTAQCYFNEIILEHYSQDIYEGTDVIYWRDGQYYNFQDVIALYKRLNNTVLELETNSLFKIQPRIKAKNNFEDPDVELLFRYYYPDRRDTESIKTLNSSIEDLGSILEKTMLNRTFYEFLWKAEIKILIPIIYRQKPALLQLELNSQIFSSFLIQFYLEVDILDDDQNPIKGSNNFTQNNLGIRKRHDPISIDLEMPYLEWIVLFFSMAVFALEFAFLVRRNEEVNQFLRTKIRQEKKIQKMMNQFDQNDSPQRSMKVNNSSNQSKEEENVDTSQQNFKIPRKYQPPLTQRIQKIGAYYLVEVILSILSLFSFYNNHNGLVCFFAWMKLMIYLSQTKNRLMVGFLFEQALPIYFKIFLNIIILITAFVMFDMLVYATTRKFETVELSYFEYFFNYFQYGIYENFILGLDVHGMAAQFFYFLQLMFLLYIGNNILQSVLASQVLKNSYLKSVQEMIDEIKIECPACGADPKDQEKIHHEHYRGSNKPALVSKFLSDYEFSMRKSQTRKSSNYNIVISSPLLSPFFPKKNQKDDKTENFVSPTLKGGKFQKRMKQINERAQQNENSPKKNIEELNKYSNNMDKHKKKMKIEIAESRIHPHSDKQNKLHGKIRSKLDILFKKIEKFEQIHKQIGRQPHSHHEHYHQAREQILNNLLTRIEKMSNTSFQLR